MHESKNILHNSEINFDHCYKWFFDINAFMKNDLVIMGRVVGTRVGSTGVAYDVILMTSCHRGNAVKAKRWSIPDASWADEHFDTNHKRLRQNLTLTHLFLWRHLMVSVGCIRIVRF